VAKAKTELKQTDAHLTYEDEAAAQSAGVQARRIQEKANMKMFKVQMKHVLKQIHQLIAGDKTGKMKKLASKGVVSSEKLQEDELALEEYFKYEQHIEDDLYQHAKHLKGFAVGDNIAQQDIAKVVQQGTKMEKMDHVLVGKMKAVLAGAKLLLEMLG
jgi:hypothetical protein